MTSETEETVLDLNYQARVHKWVVSCFGEAVAADGRERNHRFLEEALELVQSTGCTASEAQQLVDYVFGRDIGEPGQEVGGVMNTLAALCNAHGLDLEGEAEKELARVWTISDRIRAKHAAKPKHSPLPGALSRAPEAEDRLADEKHEVVAALYKAWPDAEDIPSDWPLGIIGCIEQIINERDEALSALSPPSTGGEGEAVAWRVFCANGEWFYQTDKPTAFNPAHIEPLYLHPSPEMGEIIRELQNIRVGMLDHYQAATVLERLVQKAQALKLKENGLSREELGGLARSQPGGDAQERSPVPPLSDGGAA